MRRHFPWWGLGVAVLLKGCWCGSCDDGASSETGDHILLVGRMTLPGLSVQSSQDMRLSAKVKLGG